MLNQTECRLLTLLGAGLTFKESAPLMGVTIGTALRHAHRAYRKMGVDNKRAALYRHRWLGCCVNNFGPEAPQISHIPNPLAM